MLYASAVVARRALISLLLRKCRYLLEKALVAVVPGDAFGAPDCLRMSYATSLEMLEKAMDRIEDALKPENFEN